MLALRGLLPAGLTCLALLLPAQWTGAAEIDPYLPEDTEVISTLNVKQLLASPLIKKVALPNLKDLVNNDQVKPHLEELGFDPLKDLDRITTAGPGGNENDRGLIIIHGQFDLAKFKAKADKEAKDNGDVLKIHKIADGKGGDFVLYEVASPDLPVTMWVALASEKTMLVSPGKDYVVDALKRKEKPVLKSKDFQTLLEKMDPRQSFSIAALGNALAKGDLPDKVKDALKDMEIGGGITVNEDIALELIGNAKTPQAAKELAQNINDGLNQGLGILGLLASQQKELAPVVEIAKTVKSSARDKTVTLKAAIPAELLEKWTRKD